MERALATLSPEQAAHFRARHGVYERPNHDTGDEDRQR
jgi:hypothetical protein